MALDLLASLHTPFSFLHPSTEGAQNAAEFKITQTTGLSEEAVSEHFGSQQICEPEETERGTDESEAELSTGNDVLYQLNHADGSQSLVRLQPGQSLVLEDEHGVKQVNAVGD